VTDALGTPRLHLRETTSTNDRARELAAAGAPHGTVVTAAAQTAGRGRQGRTWSAPPGHALLLSVVVRGAGDRFALLPLAAAVAVCDVAGPDARIKWPNDVLLPGEDTGAGPGRKVAGILCEGRPQEGWAVIGIGLNVAVRVEDLPAELHGTAGSLGRDPSELEPTLRALLLALDAALTVPSDVLLDRWRERDGLRGREVRWAGGSGTAAGIDGTGRLVVELAGGGRTALDAGEVHLERPPT
jgi:BirA family transcriptional regulator, biotin operon repressor / biotin---[acetyl-CoA-carboxylase] ligase